MKKDSKKKSTTPKTSADTWKERYDIAVNNQESMFKKFSDWYKLMYATVDDSNVDMWEGVPYVQAQLMAIKDGIRYHGELRI